MDIQQIANFYSSLSKLLESGHSLPAALDKAKLPGGKSDPESLGEVRGLLESGQLEAAFESLGLPRRDRLLLATGQERGALPRVCGNLADIYQQWGEILQKLVLFSLYFIVVGVLLCLVLGILTIYLGSLLAGAVLGIGLLFGWFYLLIQLYLTFKNLITGTAGGLFYTLLSRLPFLSDLLENLQYYLFCKQWELSYRAGVKLERIMQELAEVFPAHQVELELVARNFSQGQNLREAELLAEVIPRDDYRRLCAGQESGKLDEVLAELAEAHRVNVIDISEKLPGILLMVAYLIFIPLVLAVVIYFYSTYYSRLFSVLDKV